MEPLQVIVIISIVFLGIGCFKLITSAINYVTRIHVYITID